MYPFFFCIFLITHLEFHESSVSFSCAMLNFFQDSEGALDQQAKFADNITDIADIEEHFKGQQKLMSGIGMLEKEVNL